MSRRRGTRRPFPFALVLGALAPHALPVAGAVTVVTAAVPAMAVAAAVPATAVTAAVPATAVAATTTAVPGRTRPAALLERARALALADERAWHRLLHYHRSSVSGRLVSHVDDPRFFLAGAAGRDDPAAELEATIAVLFGDASSVPTGAPATDPPPADASTPPAVTPPAATVPAAMLPVVTPPAMTPPAATAGAATLPDDPIGATPADDDPRCRFVARAAWLRARLAPLAPPPPEPCGAYVRWRDTLRADSVTLVFPAAYLNNPSSMFGHTLLRLDPPEIDSGSDWLSWSLNFAADTGGDTPRTASYAWKGLSGGYPGHFLLEPYFRKLREYGAIENRDIREYRLDLTPEEVGRLVEHVWELRGISFDYFFFRENCSYRLLELLDHARPGLELAAPFRFSAIPSDTVRAVAEAGMIRDSDWLPSSATLLRHEVMAVPKASRPWIERLARAPERATDAAFAALDASRRRDVVVAANRLMTYRARREPPSRAAAARRLAMLSLLSGYAPRRDPGPPPPPPPEDGHDSTLVTLGVGRTSGRGSWPAARGGRGKADGDGRPDGQGDGQGDGRGDGRGDGHGYVEAGLRLSYHDLLDRPAGYLPGAAIGLGELRVRAFDDGSAELRSLDLVSIRSLGAPVPFLPAPSWGVDVGLARDEALEGGRLSLRAAGLVGLSRAPIGDGTLLYALGGPSLNLFARDDGTLKANAHLRLGALHHGRFGGTRLELGVDSLQGRAPRLVVELAHDVPLSRNRALRASWSASRLGDARPRVVSLDYRVHF